MTSSSPARSIAALQTTSGAPEAPANPAYSLLRSYIAHNNHGFLPPSDQEVFDLLVRALASGTLVAFVGAGLTRAHKFFDGAVMRENPSWEALPRRLFEALDEDERNAVRDWAIANERAASDDIAGFRAALGITSATANVLQTEALKRAWDTRRVELEALLFGTLAGQPTARPSEEDIAQFSRQLQKQLNQALSFHPPLTTLQTLDLVLRDSTILPPHQDGDRLRRVVRNIFLPNSPDSIHFPNLRYTPGDIDPFQSLLDLPIHRFITTNYNFEIEKALWKYRGSDLGRPLTSRPGVEISRWFTQHERWANELAHFSVARERDHAEMVFHCHGHPLEPGTLVLTEEDYQRWYFPVERAAEQRTHLQTALDVLLSSNPILFVGYGINDDDLKQTLRLFGTADRKAGHRSRLFAVLQPDEYKQRRDELWMRYRVMSVPLHVGDERAHSASDETKQAHDAHARLFRQLGAAYRASRDQWLKFPVIRRIARGRNTRELSNAAFATEASPGHLNLYGIVRADAAQTKLADFPQVLAACEDWLRIVNTPDDSPTSSGTTEKTTAGVANAARPTLLQLCSRPGSGKERCATAIYEHFKQMFEGTRRKVVLVNLHECQDLIQVVDQILFWIMPTAAKHRPRTARLQETLLEDANVLILHGLDRLLTRMELSHAPYMTVVAEILSTLASSANKSLVVVTTRNRIDFANLASTLGKNAPDSAAPASFTGVEAKQYGRVEVVLSSEIPVDKRATRRPARHQPPTHAEVEVLYALFEDNHRLVNFAYELLSRLPPEPKTLAGGESPGLLGETLRSRGRTIASRQVLLDELKISRRERRSIALYELLEVACGVSACTRAASPQGVVTSETRSTARERAERSELELAIELTRETLNRLSQFSGPFSRDAASVAMNDSAAVILERRSAAPPALAAAHTSGVPASTIASGGDAHGVGTTDAAAGASPDAMRAQLTRTSGALLETLIELELCVQVHAPYVGEKRPAAQPLLVSVDKDYREFVLKHRLGNREVAANVGLAGYTSCTRIFGPETTREGQMLHEFWRRIADSINVPRGLQPIGARYATPGSMRTAIGGSASQIGSRASDPTPDRRTVQPTLARDLMSLTRSRVHATTLMAWSGETRAPFDLLGAHLIELLEKGRELTADAVAEDNDPDGFLARISNADASRVGACPPVTPAPTIPSSWEIMPTGRSRVAFDALHHPNAIFAIGDLVWLYSELGLAYYVGGSLREAYIVLRSAVEVSRVIDLDHEYRPYIAQAQLQLAQVLVDLGLLSDASELLRACELLTQRVKDDELPMRVVGYQAKIDSLQGRTTVADAKFRRCLRVLRERNRRAYSLFLRHYADHLIAAAMADESSADRRMLEIDRFTDLDRVVANVNQPLIARAIGLLEESLAYAQAERFHDLEGFARRALGRAYRARGDIAMAKYQIELALGFASRSQLWMLETEVAYEQSRCALLEGDAVAAQERAIHCLKLANEHCPGRMQTLALLAIAVSLLPEGKTQRQHSGRHWQLARSYLNESAHLAERQTVWTWLRQIEALQIENGMGARDAPQSRLVARE